MANSLYTNAQWEYSAYCDFVISEGKIFFINYHNSPIVLDIHKGTSEYVNNIENYSEIFKLSPIEKMLQLNGKIYGFEAKSETLVIYDPKEKCCQYKEIDFHQNASMNFVLIASYGDSIYVFPKYRDFIFKIDTKVDKIIKVDNKTYAQMEKKEVVAEINGGYVYFFQWNSNKVMEYDLAVNQCKEYSLPHGLGNIIFAQCYGGQFYLLSRGGELTVWDVKVNTLETLVSAFKAENLHYFSSCTVTEKNIWLLPNYGSDIYIYCKENGKLEKYDEYPDDFAYLREGIWKKYMNCHEYENIFYYGMHSANCVLCIEKYSGKEKWIKPILYGRMEECQYYVENKFQTTLKEEEFPLEKFIEALSKAL